MRNLISNCLIFLGVVTTLNILQSCNDKEYTVGEPTISSFTHATGGPIGTYVKISGTYFSETASLNTVKFNGVAATILTANPTLITTTVPTGATSGKITVTVGGHTASSATDFTVTAGTPSPVIFSFNPSTGYGIDGVAVTIKGLNFSATAANNAVKFNGMAAATPTSASATSLTAIVPAGATTGKITIDVTGALETGTSENDFAIPKPSVDSFTPTFSITGSTVVITGSNFSKTAANNIVKFGATAAATPTNVSATSLTVIVPIGATTNKISVTVDGQTGTSKDNFVIN